jgi:hypothetical protein
MSTRRSTRGSTAPRSQEDVEVQAAAHEADMYENTIIFRHAGPFPFCFGRLDR